MKKLIFIILCTSILFTGCSKENSTYKNAMNQFEGKRYEEASSNFKKAIKLNPEKAEYYIGYGMTLIKLGETSEALIQFEKATLDKDNKIVRQNNKKALRGAGIAYFENAQYKKSVEKFDKAIEITELEDLNKDILLYKMDALDKLGDYEEAEKVIDGLLEKDKKSAVLLKKKAEMLQRRDENQEALSYYDKAIKVEAKNYSLYIGKYLVLKKENMEEEANEVLTKALAIKSKGKDDDFQVARIKFYQGDYNTAEANFLELKEKFSESYYYLAEMSYDKEDYGNAITYFETYLEENETVKSAVVYHELSSCYMEKEDYEKALPLIEIGIKLNDSIVLDKLRSNEITANEKLGNFKKAYKLAKEYVKDYPDDEEMKKEIEFLATRNQ